jgi:alginate O-acetyltransferase complex protein AlgI
MLFTSLPFLVFFSITALVYWLIPAKRRWILLLASSLFFYGWFRPAYIILLSVSVIINYACGLWIGNTRDIPAKRRLLLLGIIINVLILAGFKYAVSLSDLFFSLTGPAAGKETMFNKLVLPLGISFFTFSNISYLIEVKRMNIKPEKHLGHFANFVTFFPKLLQGPIERPAGFLAQLRSDKAFDYTIVTGGMRLMVWGFFKKLVIADRLAVLVNAVYGHPDQYHGSVLVIATIFFAFQVYLDFSAWIDIARGAAAILGFNLSPNFNRPYSSKSIQEFWTRWHITLSSWLRDYVFLPSAYAISRRLSKERYAGIRTDNLIYSIAIILTFFVCGIWHGVGWNYIIWGELFALYLVFDRLTGKTRKRFYRKSGFSGIPWLFNTSQVLITFCLVSLTWVFFRAGSPGEALAILKNIFVSWNGSSALPALLAKGNFLVYPGFRLPDLVIVLIGIPLVSILEYWFYEKQLWTRFGSFPWPVRWFSYYLFVLLILAFGVFDSVSFIYFKF